MKRTEPEFPGQLVYRDGPESLDRAIRRLEAWHRTWEINNRERLTHPTFATQHEVTHEHDWYMTHELRSDGTLLDRCSVCGVYRAHVSGTETPTGKMYQALYDMKHA